MLLYFEEYRYPSELVENNLDKDLYVYSDAKTRAKIIYVGYFFSLKECDSIFILPKVFIIHGLAFGHYKPEDIVHISTIENPLKEHQYDTFVFHLSTWLYRAIDRYVKRHPETELSTASPIQNVISNRGSSSQTYLDVILKLLRFHKEHRTLFTWISRINTRGESKIHWANTIARNSPFIQENKPIYFSFRNKTKSINLDEEIIVLFYSVLNYLQNAYRFRVDSDVEYELIPSRCIAVMIQAQKGTRFLRKIRKKYFTDDLVALWKLLYTFFDCSEKIESRRFYEERLLVRNFNIVFEDMIDQLIGSNIESLPKVLKDQPDGKVVDHLYRERSLLDTNEIYFIGDSKYYKDDNEIGQYSIYKQFTYARNIIQYNIDLQNKLQMDGAKSAPVRYRDPITEGYNITPNFFIRGTVDIDNLSYADDQLEEIDSALKMNKHFNNRLFDRDTLLLKEYSINFLFVLSAYVLINGESATKQKIRLKFRNDLLSTLNRMYNFYRITPLIPIEEFVNKYFRTFIGRMYMSDSLDKYLWIALEKNQPKTEYSLDYPRIEQLAGDAIISEPVLLE